MTPKEKPLHFVSDEAAAYTERMRRRLARNKGTFYQRDYAMLGLPINATKMPHSKDRRGFVFPVPLAAKASGISTKTLYQYRAHAFQYGLFFDVIKELLAKNLDFLLIVKLHVSFNVSSLNDLKRVVANETQKKLLSHCFGRVLFKRIIEAVE